MPILVNLLGYAYIDLQADLLLATHKNPEYRDILKRIGFECTGGFSNILNMEVPNGVLDKFIRRWGRRHTNA